MKNFPVSDQLHQAIKTRAERNGRMLQAEVATALAHHLGEEFPICRESKWIPANPKPTTNQRKG